MFVFDLFGSFLPFENPIGFGAADFLEILLALTLGGFVLGWPYLEPVARRFAERTGWCMLALGMLPAVLRLALLAYHPIPRPEIYDEFGHLLVADTLRHFRLANPAHPMHRFFETFFVLQQPTYSSIYPLGQGLMLALGRAIFGSPWAGILAAGGLFCSLCYWMLRAWVPPLWALLGGLLAVIEFGPLNLWMNCYWGGYLTACAGALVFGALPRLRDRGRWRDATLLGLGLAAHLLVRPFESVFLIASAALFFAPVLRWSAVKRLLRPAIAVAVPPVAALGLTMLQNHAVTGSWTTLPYQLSQYQYGVPSTLTIQANPLPHVALTPQQALDYQMQLSFHGRNLDTLSSFLLRLEYRVRFYRFYFLPPLYLALAAFLVTMRSYRWIWVPATALLFALGTNLFPAFQFHYVAAVTCLFVLMSVAGLRWIARLPVAGREIALVIVGLCGFHFLLWYSAHLAEHSNWPVALRRYETWNSIGRYGAGRRDTIARQLAQSPGKQLVLVRYSPQHIFQEEWVYNEADIDASRVVWARDLGGEANRKLIEYYRDRAVWLLEADAQPPELRAYQPQPPPEAAPTGPSKPAEPTPRPKQPALRFENVK